MSMEQYHQPASHSMDSSFMSQQNPASLCPGCKSREVQSQHYLCEKLMKGIAERLPGDWEKLGIYLGISRTTLDKIRGDQRNKVEAWALDMFRHWWNSALPESRWQDLQQALEDVYRNDLIEFTKEFFARHQINPNNPSGEQMQRYFMQMSERIPREWRDIGINLLIPTDTLDKIRLAGVCVSHENRELQVLKHWCNGEKHLSEECKFRKLLAVLEKMGRRDVVCYIEKEVRTYLNNCRNYQMRNNFQQEFGGGQPSLPGGQYPSQHSQASIGPPSSIPPPDPDRPPVVQTPGGTTIADSLHTQPNISLHHPSDETPHGHPNGQPNPQMQSATFSGLRSQVDPSLHSHQPSVYGAEGIHPPGSMPSNGPPAPRTPPPVNEGQVFQTDGLRPVGPGGGSLPSVTRDMQNLHVNDESVNQPVNTMSTDVTADMSDTMSLNLSP